jgi:chemotaxis protein MotB
VREPTVAHPPVPDTTHLRDAALKTVQAALPGRMAGVKFEVESDPDGVLISILDQPGSSMFKVGSAEPEADVLPVLGNLSRALALETGQLVVRGHTDSRRFRSPSSDNWRLSVARAHMTQHVMIRAGLPVGRFERIEGHADRRPRRSDDTLAPENRRIEILLRIAAP